MIGHNNVWLSSIKIKTASEAGVRSGLTFKEATCSTLQDAGDSKERTENRQ